MSKASHVIDIFLQPGEFYFGDRNTRIRTILGSCVSITMWHPTLRLGAMCHYMLASRPNRRRKYLDGKYSEDAILMFFRAAVEANTDPHDYVIKIFGGGNMFPRQTQHLPCSLQPCEEVIHSCRNVSCKNGMTGRTLLKRHGFAIAAEHVGGQGHRQVIFDIGTGHVWMRQVAPISPAKDTQ